MNEEFMLSHKIILPMGRVEVKTVDTPKEWQSRVIKEREEYELMVLVERIAQEAAHKVVDEYMKRLEVGK